MRVIVCENYEEMSKKAAGIVAAQITLKPDSTLGLAQAPHLSVCTKYLPKCAAGAI